MTQHNTQYTMMTQDTSKGQGRDKDKGAGTGAGAGAGGKGAGAKRPLCALRSALCALPPGTRPNVPQYNLLFQPYPYPLLIFEELLYTPDRRRTAPRGRGGRGSSGRRSMKLGTDVTAGPTTAHTKSRRPSGASKPTRLPALKILTGVHVPHESAPVPGPPRTAKASGSVPDTPLTKGCQTWRWVGDQACCFRFSWLSVCRLLCVDMRTKGYRTRHHALCPWGSSDGTSLGSAIDGGLC
jgi:hypothetical protein